MQFRHNSRSLHPFASPPTSTSRLVDVELSLRDLLLVEGLAALPLEILALLLSISYDQGSVVLYTLLPLLPTSTSRLIDVELSLRNLTLLLLSNYTRGPHIMASGGPLGPEFPTSILQGALATLISIFLSAWLWGISAAQGYKYFKTYRQDPLWLKTLVSACLTIMEIIRVLNTVSLVSHILYAYHWTIFCRLLSNLDTITTVTGISVRVSSMVLDLTLSQQQSQPLIYVHYIIISTVQGFYALRVWTVSEKKKLLVIPIFVLSLIQLVSGLYGALYLTIKGDVNFAFAKPFVASTSTAA
ncbi:hypothetical protein M422DRAFT_70524, partial [Sphaerobolus stellatus SS14]